MLSRIELLKNISLSILKAEYKDKKLLKQEHIVGTNGMIKP